jgi:hypothetical protein
MLYYEIKEYLDKNTGEVKKAYNIYVKYNGIKIQLRPNDYTGREIINLMIEQGLLEKE